jgi:hypothetical protein
MKYKRYNPMATPILDKNDNAFFLHPDGSNILTANGTNIGQNEYAKREKTNVAIEVNTDALFPRESQSTPSTACCIPKSSGNDAKGISDFFSAFFIVTAPVADNAPPAIKLADAEKHILL